MGAALVGGIGTFLAFADTSPIFLKRKGRETAGYRPSLPVSIFPDDVLLFASSPYGHLYLFFLDRICFILGYGVDRIGTSLHYYVIQ